MRRRTFAMLAPLAFAPRVAGAQNMVVRVITPAIDVSAKYGGFAAFPADRIVYR